MATKGTNDGSDLQPAASSAPRRPRDRDPRSVPAWIVPAGFVTGIALILVVLALVVLVPDANSQQFTIFRIVLALAGAAFSLALTGFISIRLNLPGGGLLTAGGTLAVFVVIFFFTPPPADPSNSADDSEPAPSASAPAREPRPLDGIPTVAPEGPEDPATLPISELHLRLSRMTIEPPSIGPPTYVGYPNDRDGTPNYVELASEGAPIAIESGGMSDGQGRFAIVARRGSHRIERLYVRLLAFAECSLRDEYAAPAAPTGVAAYSFYITRESQVYDLVPRAEPGEPGTWQLNGPSADEFDLRLLAPSYVLFFVALVAEGREMATGERFVISSRTYPLLFTDHGNFGGCHQLERWYQPAALVRAEPARTFFQAFDGDVLTYQVATLNARADRRFLARVVQELEPPQVREVVTSLESLLAGTLSGNPVLEQNLGYLRLLIDWRSSSGTGRPP